MIAWFVSLNLLEVTGLLVWATLGFWSAALAWYLAAAVLDGRRQIRKIGAASEQAAKASRMAEHERQALMLMNEVAREFNANQEAA